MADREKEKVELVQCAYYQTLKKFYNTLIVAINIDQLISDLKASDNSKELLSALEAARTSYETNRDAMENFLIAVEKDIERGNLQQFDRLIDILISPETKEFVWDRVGTTIRKYLDHRLSCQQYAAKQAPLPSPNFQKFLSAHIKQEVHSIYSGMAQFVAVPGIVTGAREPKLVDALSNGTYKISWKAGASLPVPVYSAAALTNNGKIYITGSSSPVDDTKYEVYVYNISADHWDKLPNPPTFLAVQEIVDGRLTLFGGRETSNNDRSDRVTTFVETSCTWESIYPRMLQPRNRCSVVKHRNYVIVAGGTTTNDVCLRTIEVMDIAEKIWRISAVQLNVAMWNMSTTVANDEMFIVGYAGSDNQRYRLAHSVSAVDIETATAPVQWKILREPPRARTTIVPEWYPPMIVGGNDSEFACVSDVTIYNPNDDSWSVVDQLKTPRAYSVVAAVGDSIVIVMGGCTRARNLTTCKASALTTVEIGRPILKQQ